MPPVDSIPTSIPGLTYSGYLQAAHTGAPSAFVGNLCSAQFSGTEIYSHPTDSNPATTTNGSDTFYGRYVNWTAADNRPPLPTSFAPRFLHGGPFDGGTSLVVWRDSKVNQAPFNCSAPPSWYRCRSMPAGSS